MGRLRRKFSAEFKSKVALVAVENSDTTLIESFSYDGLGRLITQTDASGNRTDSYFAGMQEIEQRVGVTSASNGTASVLNYFSPVYTNAILARDRDTDLGGSMNERVYFTSNANFDVTAVISTAGAVLQRQTYTAYGVVTFADPTTWDDVGSDAYGLQNLFQGMRFDAAVGWYFTPTRIYSPTLDVWNAMDPTGYPNGMNGEAFCGGNTINCVDPNGTLTVRAYDIGGTFTVTTVDTGDLVKYKIDSTLKKHMVANGLNGFEVNYQPDKKHASCGMEIRVGQVIAADGKAPAWDIDSGWKGPDDKPYSHLRGLPSYYLNPMTNASDVNHGMGARGLGGGYSYFDSPMSLVLDTAVHFKIEVVAYYTYNSTILGAAYFEYTSKDGPKGRPEVYDMGKGWTSAIGPGGTTYTIKAAMPTAFANAGVSAW